MKRCRTCQKEKSLNEFGKNSANKDDRAIHCKKCSKAKHLLKLYDLPLKTYNLLIKEQSNKCQICTKTFITDDAVAVDHCHKTGKVRGLLCHKCNQGLGSFEDNVDNFFRAIQYLMKNEGENNEVQLCKM